jgi:hypothetical protein
MDASTALVRIQRTCDIATAPVVTDAEAEAILLECRLQDSSGNPPDSADWVGTYDMKLAEAKVWELKAARVAGSFDFSADGGSFKRSQMTEAFQELAAKARRRRGGRLVSAAVADEEAAWRAGGF